MGVFDWKHWLVVLLVALLLFGGKRLRHIGSDLGEAIKGFRKSINDTADGVLADKPHSDGERRDS
ncbi:twin-arginine translocase TatA/TatE family subunit [Pseudomonas aeruginosa]|uniref:twin-arginine translocase TatA/TatE family subunit n=1 Tax=Pseudomonas aeruginosa TaxID=287 RepID=UPI001A94C171|nr:twin-arginine translocase TatA/TatE family subunit [Pseudomonas aeruginosa]MBO0968709.1 twin-arginine translocase TatA/TatE family subunit [Pseudomonas aeruginosa]MCV4098651.1 twin-arginine translocase TatA/TatE family subunit [Pseudomonas aeruginosa]MDG4275137.1 twin-arginine translocase TatA/TatE family subunit [Pseudomonas aeruginosa]HBO3911221.1 twin-arginine translocase TatA/TatE family subunit [Pseudomonas aeruginosa]HCF5875144.1 twin-arginine translocase TatA/TatE family subunit [Pse